MFNINLGRWFGIPLVLDESLLILFVIFLILSGISFIPILLIIFVSVLIHEFAHSFVARSFGFKVRKIILHCFGGTAQIEIQEGSDKLSYSKKELIIAAAGPISSLILSIVFLGIFAFSGITLFGMVFYINFILFIFNIIPAWPLDGGKVLRSLLMIITKKWRLSNNITFGVAKICLILMIAFGLYIFSIPMVLISCYMLLSSHRKSKETLALIDNESIRRWEMSVFTEEID